MRIPEVKNSKNITFKVWRNGMVALKGKRITKATRDKYASDILAQNFKIASDNSYRNKKGQFITIRQRELAHRLITQERERTEEKIKFKKSIEVDKKPLQYGHIMMATHAYTFRCTCFIQDKSYIKHKKGDILQHYYTISASKEPRFDYAVQSHNSDYPAHDLIEIELSSTKVIQI